MLGLYEGIGTLEDVSTFVKAWAILSGPFVAAERLGAMFVHFERHYGTLKVTFEGFTSEQKARANAVLANCKQDIASMSEAVKFIFPEVTIQVV